MARTFVTAFEAVQKKKDAEERGEPKMSKKMDAREERMDKMMMKRHAAGTAPAGDTYFQLTNGQMTPLSAPPTTIGAKYIVLHADGSIEQRTVGDMAEPGQPDTAMEGMPMDAKEAGGVSSKYAKGTPDPEEKGEPKLSRKAELREERMEKMTGRHATGTSDIRIHDVHGVSTATGSPATTGGQITPPASNQGKAYAWYDGTNGDWVLTDNPPATAGHVYDYNNPTLSRTDPRTWPTADQVSSAPDSAPAQNRVVAPNVTRAGGPAGAGMPNRVVVPGLARDGVGAPPPTVKPPPTVATLPGHQTLEQKAAAMANNGAGSWAGMNENRAGAMPMPQGVGGFPLGMAAQPDANGMVPGDVKPPEMPMQMAPNGSVLQSNDSLNMDPVLRGTQDYANSMAVATDGGVRMNGTAGGPGWQPTIDRTPISKWGDNSAVPQFLPDGSPNPAWAEAQKMTKMQGMSRHAAGTNLVEDQQQNNPAVAPAPARAASAGPSQVAPAGVRPPPPARAQPLYSGFVKPVNNVAPAAQPMQATVPQAVAPTTVNIHPPQPQQAPVIGPTTQQSAATSQVNSQAAPTVTTQMVQQALQYAAGNKTALDQLLSDLGVTFAGWNLNHMDGAQLANYLQRVQAGLQPFDVEQMMTTSGATHSVTPPPPPPPPHIWQPGDPQPDPNTDPDNYQRWKAAQGSQPPPASPVNGSAAQLALRAATGDMAAVSLLEQQLGVQGSLDTSHVDWAQVTLHLQRAAAGLEAFDPQILQHYGAVANVTPPPIVPHVNTPAETELVRQQRLAHMVQQYRMEHPGQQLPRYLQGPEHPGRTTPRTYANGTDIPNGVTRGEWMDARSGAGGVPGSVRRHAIGTNLSRTQDTRPHNAAVTPGDAPPPPTPNPTPVTPPAGVSPPPAATTPSTPLVPPVSTPPPPGPQTITYDPEVYNNLPIMRYLRGQMNEGQYLTPGQFTSNVPGLGLEGLPSPNSWNARALQLAQQNPSDWAALSSILKAGNRDINQELAATINAAPTGNAYPTTSIRTVR